VFGVGEFGRLRREHVDAAMRAASVVVLPSFEMRLDTVASFGRARRDGRMHRRPLVLFGEAADLSELRRVLANAFKRGHAGQFAPHMTLLYSPTVIRSTRIEPFRLAVSEFVLIHSEVGLTRHHIIGRWRLAA
jgi:2'-5' RNA ligase